MTNLFDVVAKLREPDLIIDHPWVGLLIVAIAMIGLGTSATLFNIAVELRDAFQQRKWVAFFRAGLTFVLYAVISIAAGQGIWLTFPEGDGDGGFETGCGLSVRC